MKHCFPKELRLRKRRDFQRMSRFAKRCVGSRLILEMRENQMPITRLGVTVPRHYGKSHERNRFKRLVREAFRLSREKLPAGLDLNIKPRPYAKAATLALITEEIILLATSNSLPCPPT